MTTVAVAGAGRWGRNLVRNFASLPDCELRWVVEPDAGRRERIGAQYPGVRTADRLEPILADPEVDAVVISAPARDHHALGTAALRAGKHVYVEKPLATVPAECPPIVAEAEDAKAAGSARPFSAARPRSMFSGLRLHSAAISAPSTRRKFGICTSHAHQPNPTMPIRTLLTLAPPIDAPLGRHCSPRPGAIKPPRPRARDP